MKINFIRHISDDLLKENQELKTALIANKQQLNSYQEQMLSFIDHHHLQVPILATPQQTLILFISTVTQQLENYKAQQGKWERECRKTQQCTKQITHLQDELRKRKHEEELRQKKWREGLLAAEDLQYEMKQEISALKMKQQALLAQISQAQQHHKIELLLLQQAKRKDSEQVRQHHHKAIMELRDRLEEEHIIEQKKLKAQLQERQKRTKQLEKMVEKLAANSKFDGEQMSLFANMIQSLQESQRIGKSLDVLRDQNYELKRQVKELERNQMNLDSQIIENDIKEKNFQSEIQRQQLERLEIESKYSSKIKELQRCQKDKESMESYYSNKWNQEFNHVKANLEKNFTLKLEQEQRNYAKKTEELQNKMDEGQAQIRKYQSRNKQLETLFQSHQTSMNHLQGILEESHQELRRVKKEYEQAWRLSREDIIATKVQNEQKISVLYSQIGELEEELVRRDKKNESINNKFSQTLRQKIEEGLSAINNQMIQQKERFIKERSQIVKEHAQKTSELKEEVSHLRTLVETIKGDVVQQYEQRIHTIIQTKEHKLKQKDEDCLKKLEKANIKQKEVDLKLASLKKEIQEERQTFSRDVYMYQREIEAFNKIRVSLEEEIAKHSLVKEELQLQKEEAQEETSKVKKVLKDKNQQIQKLKEENAAILNKNQELLTLQTNWENQLTQVQLDLRAEFSQLKAASDQKIQVLKSKIWYLEEKAKQPIISQKNYEKLKELQVQKQELKNMVDIKQAQNIVLSQVKDYYETRFRETESRSSDKGMRLILKRKLTHTRKQSCKQTTSSREEPQEVIKMKKYIMNYNRKQQHLAMSRTGYKEFQFWQKMKTNPV